MRDTANILLGSDLRQAEVTNLFNIITKETNDTANPHDYSLAVKLVKGAIDRELEETRMFNPISILINSYSNFFILYSLIMCIFHFYY